MRQAAVPAAHIAASGANIASSSLTESGMRAQIAPDRDEFCMAAVRYDTVADANYPASAPVSTTRPTLQ